MGWWWWLRDAWAEEEVVQPPRAEELVARGRGRGFIPRVHAVVVHLCPEAEPERPVRVITLQTMIHAKGGEAGRGREGRGGLGGGGEGG